MSRTDTFKKNALKKLFRQPLPLWISKIKGKGFYVIRNHHVVKAIVGDVIISSKPIAESQFDIYFGDFNFRKYREELIVKLVLYASPYDVVKADHVLKERDYTHEDKIYDPIHAKGIIGVYGIDELYKTKHEALEATRNEP